MDVQFTFTIPNLAELVAAFKSAPGIVQPILTRALAASQALLAKYTGQNTPYRSGYLRGSFLFVPEPLQAHWIPKADYALYVEEGTGLYGPSHARIVPKQKKALFWPGADHPVRSTAGMKPRQYMEKILAAATPELITLFETAENQITAAIAADANGAK